MGHFGVPESVWQLISLQGLHISHLDHQDIRDISHSQHRMTPAVPICLCFWLCYIHMWSNLSDANMELMLSKGILTWVPHWFSICIICVYMCVCVIFSREQVVNVFVHLPFYQGGKSFPQSFSRLYFRSFWSELDCMPTFYAVISKEYIEPQSRPITIDLLGMGTLLLSSPHRKWKM